MRERAATHLAPLAYPSRHSGAGRNPFLSVSACETLSDKRETGVWFPACAGMTMRGHGGDDVTQARSHTPNHRSNKPRPHGAEERGVSGEE